MNDVVSVGVVVVVTPVNSSVVVHTNLFYKYGVTFTKFLQIGSTSKKPIIIKRDSLQVETKELIEKANGPYRMFSVDGGHSTDVALHDLRLANEVLVDGGIIMLDDYFDPKFPGVSEAVCRFFLLHSGEVRVAHLFITGNKLFLETTNYAQLYRKAIDDAIDRAREEVWDAEVFGSKVITIL